MLKRYLLIMIVVSQSAIGAEAGIIHSLGVIGGAASTIAGTVVRPLSSAWTAATNGLWGNLS